MTERNREDQDAMVRVFNDHERINNASLIEMQDAAYKLGRERGRQEILDEVLNEAGEHYREGVANNAELLKRLRP